ncbi:hypothetical protein KJ965_00490 [Patescibacteria group bacterium]|nr:hypothetical protein [Patescibacteria group bacterium]
MANLSDIVVSRVRTKLLITFLDQPQEIYYVRQLVRLNNEEINAVRRELGRMEEKGLVKKEPRGNRLYYQFRKDYPYYNELVGLVAKNVGLGANVLANRNKLGRVRFAMLSGRFMRRLPRQNNEVDLVIIGQVNMPQLAALVREEENRLKIEINYTVMSIQEFSFRKARRDPFILSILAGSRIMIVGDEQEMLLLKDDETKGN